MKECYGVVIGTVKEVDSKRGQVKVDFPWLTPPQRSDWAPIAGPMSGKNRGIFFMPEIDDEVLVAFEHGAFDHPFVVGFLWNGVDTSPESTPKNRVILTPGGHTLRFEDADGQKKVVLKSNSGHEIVLDDGPAGQKITLRTAGVPSQSIVLDDVAKSIQLSGGYRTLRLMNGQVQIL
jgi:uncharacterized protein involved in type VI secretion and phage assembly